ncbi:MAG: ATP-binding protein [bacterium]|nr:ATP-binding protein [bacterium]
MASSSAPLSATDTPTERPADGGGPASGRRDERWQVRLVVTVPALLILFILAYGLVSYLSFSQYWPDLAETGALEISGRLLRVHLMAMLVLSVLALTAGLALTWSILRPIRAIARTAEMVARGRLDRLAPRLPASRELDEFSQTFNTMVERVSRTISERNRGLVEGIPIGIVTTDMDGRINALNPLAAQMLGVEAGDVVGRTIGELGERLPGVARAMMAQLAGGPAGGAPIMRDEQPAESGDGAGALSISAATMRNSETAPLGAVFTLRETAQVRDLSAHLSQTDQLAMLGAFALGLAHQLRNPLGAVKGISQLLATQPGLPADVAPYLERMGREVDRADKVVAELLDLAHQPAILATPTPIEEVVEQAVAKARRGLTESKVGAVRLVRDLAPMAAPTIQGERLSDAFAQVIRNAYQATPPGGTIHIHSRLHANGRRQRWEVCIENNGSTIGPGNRERIFEPFFTTRERATGLGLTLARQIVTQNGGRLEARESDGTVAFVATFESPAADPEPAGQREG